MNSEFTFHNKYHRYNHHTLGFNGIPDAALDPIASQEEPFIGVFYNTLTDNLLTYTIQTNSLEWWSAYDTVKTLSAAWAPTLSLYITVNTLSSNWDAGYLGYTVFSGNSSKYESSYTTLQTYSAEWNSPQVMYLNKAQESTASKTFSGTNLTVTTAPSTIDWDLDTNQVTFVSMTSAYFLNNPLNMRRGGNYVLIVKQVTSGKDLFFDTAYRFNGTPYQSGIINTATNGTTVITFICDGTLMFGDQTYYIE